MYNYKSYDIRSIKVDINMNSIGRPTPPNTCPPHLMHVRAYVYNVLLISILYIYIRNYLQKKNKFAKILPKFRYIFFDLKTQNLLHLK